MKPNMITIIKPTVLTLLTLTAFVAPHPRPHARGTTRVAMIAPPSRPGVPRPSVV
jgi:hypothetical protein